MTTPRSRPRSLGRGPVGVLGRGVERADGQCDHAGAQAVGPRGDAGGLRADLRAGRRGGLCGGRAGRDRSGAGVVAARVVALAECGTHAVVAAEVDAWSVGEKTLAHRLYPRLNPEEVLTADRNFY